MTIDQLQRHLIRMNDDYQEACRAFAAGEISAEEARVRVTDLSYTDPVGHTWRIDTARSGHMAAFTDGTTELIDDHEIVASELLAPLVAEADVPDEYSLVETGRRLRPMLIGLAFTAILAGLPIGYLLVDQKSSTTTNSGLPQPSVIPLTTTGATTGGLEPPTTTPSPPATTPTTSVAAVPPAISINGLSREEVPFDTQVEFGRSVEDRPLLVERRGESGGVRVLVVGVIHGNEQAGLEVVKLLHSMDLGPGVDLWLVPTMNPDGIAANTRQNANDVDLNRNFPRNWTALGTRGDWEFSGPSAASEPEVTALMTLAQTITPDFVVWYHQDYFRISPSTGRAGAIRQRYAELVDLPLLVISGGTYTGTAGSWMGTALAPNGASMLVEFGESLREGEAQANADAILAIVHEFFS